LVTPKVIIAVAFVAAFIMATVLLFVTDREARGGTGNGYNVVNLPIVY